MRRNLLRNSTVLLEVRYGPSDYCSGNIARDILS